MGFDLVYKRVEDVKKISKCVPRLFALLLGIQSEGNFIIEKDYHDTI